MKTTRKSAGHLVILDNSDPITEETERIQSRIRERAYELSQMRGHPGREMDDWLSAESEVMSVPPAEMIEKEGVFQVRFAVGDINPEDLQVMATTAQMLVMCDRRHEHDPDAGTVHLCDFRAATVFRSVQFPRPVEVKSIKTQLKDGILQVSAAIEGAAPASPRAPARKPVAKKAAKA